MASSDVRLVSAKVHAESPGANETEVPAFVGMTLWCGGRGGCYVIRYAVFKKEKARQSRAFPNP